jgi:hypothetical protein
MPTSPAERDDCGPSISVVIPCYNAAAFLRATIASILGQAVREGDAERAAEIAAGLVALAGPMRHLLPATLAPPRQR